MNILENVCPVCKTKNALEAIVCSHCGAKLEDPFMDPGAKTKTTDMPALVPEKMQEGIRDWSTGNAAIPAAGIAVYIEGESDPVYVDSKGEFVIGRKVGDASDVSLDLSHLGAYHLGLSRRHARIQWADDGYQVLDLGSVNGTWLNGEKLIPHKAYPLASGSHLRLGRMPMFVLYRLP
jgi:hypothetical protein